MYFLLNDRRDKLKNDKLRKNKMMMRMKTMTNTTKNKIMKLRDPINLDDLPDGRERWLHYINLTK